MSDVPETGRNDSDWLTAAATEVNFDYEVIMRPDTVVPDRYAAGLDSFNYSITAIMPLTLNDLQIDFSRVTREYGYPVYKIKMGAERDVVTEVEAHPAEVVDDTMFSHICAVIMKGLNNDGQDFRRVFPHGQGAFLHILPSTDNSYRHITYIGPHSGKYLFKTTLSSNSNRSNVVNHSTRAAIRETKALLGQAQGPLRGGECRRFYMSSGMLDKVYERIQFQEDNTQMQEPLGSPSTHIVPPHEVGCMPWAMSASSYLTDYGKFLLGYALYTCNMNPSANFYVSFDLNV